MKSTMKSIRFPESVLKEIKPALSRNKLNFTQFVMEAIKTYIRIMKHNNSIEQSFGAWKDNNHTELKKGVNQYVRKMRKGRKF